MLGGHWNSPQSNPVWISSNPSSVQCQEADQASDDAASVGVVLPYSAPSLSLAAVRDQHPGENVLPTIRLIL